MKIILKIIITVMLSLIFQICIGQSDYPSKKIWQIKSATHLKDGKTFLCSGLLEFNENQIRFKQKGGLITYDFAIRKIVRQKLTDKMVMEVAFRGGSGDITWIEENGFTSVTINLSKDNQQILPYRFVVH
ncbi:MAG: hypothetical protein RL161_83 [Bacteroidota bacterium]|jgi:hypothetical protein